MDFSNGLLEVDGDSQMRGDAVGSKVYLRAIGVAGLAIWNNV